MSFTTHSIEDNIKLIQENQFLIMAGQYIFYVFVKILHYWNCILI